MNNPFEELCNEKIVIERKDKERLGPFKAAFGKGQFTVWDGSIEVDDGDFIDRPLPNGKAERYDIVEVHYSHQFHDIPAHVDMKVRKQGALVPYHPPRTVNISIRDSQGFQVGDHNVQNIVNSFRELIQHIDNAAAPAEAKKEAKSLMKAFLEHPLTSAVIGDAVSGVTGQLK